jgi:Flp pilus assembly protein TadG
MAYRWKFLRADRGNALVELAVMLPGMLMTVFFISDTAIWVQRAMQVQSAAAAGAAYGAVPGNSSNHTGMVQIANYAATGSTSGATGFSAVATDFYTCSPGGSTVTATTSCSTGAPFHYVKVTTSATVSSIVKFTGIPTTLTMPAAAIFRVEVTP